MKHYWIHNIKWGIEGLKKLPPTDCTFNVPSKISAENVCDYLNNKIYDYYCIKPKSFKFMEIGLGKTIVIV